MVLDAGHIEHDVQPALQYGLNASKIKLFQFGFVLIGLVDPKSGIDREPDKREAQGFDEREVFGGQTILTVCKRRPSVSRRL